MLWALALVIICVFDVIILCSVCSCCFSNVSVFGILISIIFGCCGQLVVLLRNFMFDLLILLRCKFLCVVSLLMYELLMLYGLCFVSVQFNVLKVLFRINIGLWIFVLFNCCSKYLFVVFYVCSGLMLFVVGKCCSVSEWKLLFKWLIGFFE